MKKLNYLFLGIISIFIMSCAKDYNLKLDENSALNLKNINKDSLNVLISGQVLDFNTNSPVKEAVIIYSGKSIKADTLGRYAIKDSITGNQFIKVSAPGYCTIMDTIEIKAENIAASNCKVNVINTLVKSNQTLATQLYLNIGGKSIPAANAKYSIELGANIVPKLIEGQADKDGKILVANLPNIQIKLRAELTYNNKLYAIYSSSSLSSYDYYYGIPRYFSNNINMYLLTSNSTFRMLDINLLDDEGLPNTSFVKTNNIVVKFSSEANASNSSAYYKLYKITNSQSPVAVVSSWSADLKTLTVNPLGDSLEAGATYYFEMRVYPKSGSSYDYSIAKSFSFTVAGAANQVKLGKVIDIKKVYPTTIGSTTPYTEITFPKISGANSYAVYGKYDNSEFIKLTNYSISSWNNLVSVSFYFEYLPGIVIPNDGIFSNGKTYTIIIRAENYDGYVGEFSDPFIFKKDSNSF